MKISNLVQAKKQSSNSAYGVLTFTGAYDDVMLNLHLKKCGIDEYKVLHMDANAGVLVFNYVFKFIDNHLKDGKIVMKWYNQLTMEYNVTFQPLIPTR